MYDVERTTEIFARLMNAVRDQLNYQLDHKKIDNKAYATILNSLMDDALKLAYDTPFKEREFELQEQKLKEEIKLLQSQVGLTDTQATSMASETAAKVSLMTAQAGTEASKQSLMTKQETTEEKQAAKIEKDTQVAEAQRLRIVALYPEEKAEIAARTSLISEQKSKTTAEAGLVAKQALTETSKASLLDAQALTEEKQANKIDAEKELIGSQKTRIDALYPQEKLELTARTDLANAEASLKGKQAISEEIRANNMAQIIGNEIAKSKAEICLLKSQSKERATAALLTEAEISLTSEKKQTEAAQALRITREASLLKMQREALINKTNAEIAIAKANVKKIIQEKNLMWSRIITEGYQRKLLSAQKTLVVEQAKGVDKSAQIRLAEVKAKVYSTHIATNGIDQLASGWSDVPSVSVNTVNVTEPTDYAPSSTDTDGITLPADLGKITEDAAPTPSTCTISGNDGDCDVSVTVQSGSGDSGQ